MLARGSSVAAEAVSVNYIELHIGDFERDTAHLTVCEEGVYGRLLRLYYKNEGPLADDVPALQRLVRARSRDEKAAVPAMLREFFNLVDGAWQQGRCDREIAKYQDKRAKAQRSAKARWNDSEGNADAMRTHTEGNAHQTPDSSLHASIPESSSYPPAAVGQVEGHENPKPASNPAAGMAVALNKAGVRCTSLNPDLIAYAEAGGTVDHLLQVLTLPACKDKPAAYLIRIARREMAERAAPVAASGQQRPAIAPHNPGGVSPRLSPEDEKARQAEALAAMERWKGDLGHAA